MSCLRASRLEFLRILLLKNDLDVAQRLVHRLQLPVHGSRGAVFCIARFESARLAHDLEPADGRCSLHLVQHAAVKVLVLAPERDGEEEDGEGGGAQAGGAAPAGATSSKSKSLFRAGRAATTTGAGKAEPAMLSVKVIAGRNLAPKDSNGTSDPFCVFKYEKQKFTTAVQKKTLNPEWDEQFVFQVHDEAAVVQLKVWHSDKFTRDFYAQQGMTLGAAERVPDDPYIVKRENADVKPSSGQVKGRDAYAQFLEHDGDVLAFYATGGQVHHHAFPTHWPLTWLAVTGAGLAVAAVRSAAG